MKQQSWHYPVWLLVAGLLACVALGVRPAAAVPPRGEAQVAVMADLTHPDVPDQVSIHLTGADKRLLLDLALALGVKFKASPAGMTYVTGDPDVRADQSLGMELTLLVVPRGDGYLPIAPFVEVLAPYAAKVRLVYVIKGPFIYRGVQSYTAKGLTVTVDPPEMSDPGTGIPVAFYGIHAMITNPALGPLDMPHYASDTGTGTRRIWRILGWLLLAGLLGAGLGILVARLIARWKAAAGIS